MASSAMSSKGQITVPQEIREALRLQKGDRVSFRMRKDGVVELIPESLDLMSLQGMLKPRRKGVSLADMEEAIADGVQGR